MCGRFSITTPWEAIHERFQVELPEGEFPKRFNAAPGQKLPVVEMHAPNQVSLFQWGLVPEWARDPKIGQRLINARAETLSEKPAWRQSLRTDRCLVLADGFYEWDKKGKIHIPYRITLKGQPPFAFAGLAAHWQEGQKKIDSFSIITTVANALVGKIHDRMPVILPPEAEKVWLDPETDEKGIRKLLKAFPARLMESYPISTLINNPRNDFAAVLHPVSTG